MDRDTRSEINRALARAIAHKDCGNHTEAAKHARELVRLLGCANILTTDTVSG
ncbi:MAG: hypothetical protein ACRDRO_26010 [Pseudonocardiaceae bacterium]